MENNKEKVFSILEWYWPNVTIVTGLIIGSLANNPLAAVMWLVACVLGYMAGVQDTFRRIKNNG